MGKLGRTCILEPGMTFALESLISEIFTVVMTTLLSEGRCTVIRTILVPLDGSEFGEHALPLAISLAHTTGAKLHLVHVHQPAPPVPVAGFEMVDLFDLHLREDEEAYLADVKRRVSQLGELVPITTLLTDADVARALREYAQAHNAEYVVTSTHGRGTMGRWWLGSVTDELARTLPQPMVMVRPGEGKADLQRRPQLKTIVIPLDGTPLAEQVIEPAIRLGEPFGANFCLLRVCPPVLRKSYLPEGTTLRGMSHGLEEQIGVTQRKAEIACQDYLNEVASRFASRCLHWSTCVPVEEDPADGILECARKRNADLIAMETHGRTGLTRLFMGSIADKVIRSGDVPVLVNRPSH